MQRKQKYGIADLKVMKNILTNGQIFAKFVNIFLPSTFYAIRYCSEHVVLNIVLDTCTVCIWPPMKRPEKRGS